MKKRIHAYGGLVPGVLIRRYKRFLADVKIRGKKITVFCPNSGSMMGCSEPGSEVMLSPAADPLRKTSYTLEMVEAGDVWVGVNTHLTNHLAGRIIDGEFISGFHFRIKRREVVHGDSRLDLLLGHGDSLCYAEVKNVSLRDQDGTARFPDAQTERGRKHLRSLMDIVGRGHRAALFFVVQREDCRRFGPADDIDPEYGRVLRTAMKRGVEVHALLCEVRPEGIWFVGELPVRAD